MHEKLLTLLLNILEPDGLIDGIFASMRRFSNILIEPIPERRNYSDSHRPVPVRRCFAGRLNPVAADTAREGRECFGGCQSR